MIIPRSCFHNLGGKGEGKGRKRKEGGRRSEEKGREGMGGSKGTVRLQLTFYNVHEWKVPVIAAALHMSEGEKYHTIKSTITRQLCTLHIQCVISNVHTHCRPHTYTQ